MRSSSAVIMLLLGIIIGLLMAMHMNNQQGGQPAPAAPPAGQPHTEPETNSGSGGEPSTSQGISLAPPPLEAVEGTATTPPLDTSQIGLIAYYERSGGWELADTVPAFVEYTDGGNYYDGLVRVWDSGYIGAESTTGDDSYVDVHVRVRADGWILAWFERGEDPGAIVWWSHVRKASGNPPEYATTLSRAIEIVFYVAGVPFPGYDKIGLYDYSEPDAKRLLIFGYSKHVHGSSDTRVFYYTIPSESPMTPIKLLVRAGGGHTGYADDGRCKLWIDDVLIYDKTDNLWGWDTYEIGSFALEKGVQHVVKVYTWAYRYVGYYSSRYEDTWHNVALIMWGS